MATEPRFDPLAILRAMSAHEVPLIVIGGFAVAAHKVVRATRDLDVVTDRSWNAARRLADALRSLDAEPASDPSITLIPEVLVRRSPRATATCICSTQPVASRHTHSWSA